jgi:hypothetical protein
MNLDEQNQRQEFFDLISNYPFFREDGRLILEPFCVHLSHCFGFDGILEKSPQPRDVYMLLVTMIHDRLGDDDARRYIQYQRISEWTPDMAYTYPEKTMTCIHTAALVKISSDWIYDIGHDLMDIPEPNEPSKYFNWVKEEWTAVYAFINGYHNAFYSFQKIFDCEGITRNGYSLFEALHLSRRKNIEFDEAVKLLLSRHESYKSALIQIEKAIINEYFLEAVALQECLISNCLFNFLENTGTKLKNPSFNTLINKISNSSAFYKEFPVQLFTSINKWREARNSSIHGYITSRSDGLSQSKVAFEKLVETTANQGLDFTKAVVSWYEFECVNFVRHEFSAVRRNILH